MMDATQRLTAVDAIRTLKARFFLAVDGKDWETYASLFTEDARFDVGGAFVDERGGESVEGLKGSETVVGGVAMAERVARLLDGATTVHLGATPLIDVTSDREARAVWPVEDWLWFAEGTGPPVVHGFGRYDERYVVTDKGWRIAEMRYTRTRLA
jgi:hypothetical protein